MVNKKGEMMWYILGLILVAIVLVIVVYGLWKTVVGPGGRLWGNDDNVGLIVQECKVACLSGLKSEYCDRTREVYSLDKSLSGKRSCSYLEDKLDDLSCDKVNC